MATTLTAVLDAIDDNADYDQGDGDITKAGLFRSAVRRAIFKIPQEAAHGDARTKYDLVTLKKMLDDVDAWLAQNDTTNVSSSGVKFADFSGFRG